MIKRLIHRYIRNLERRYDYDGSYMQPASAFASATSKLRSTRH